MTQHVIPAHRQVVRLKRGDEIYEWRSEIYWLDFDHKLQCNKSAWEHYSLKYAEGWRLGSIEEELITA